MPESKLSVNMYYVRSAMYLINLKNKIQIQIQNNIFISTKCIARLYSLGMVGVGGEGRRSRGWVKGEDEEALGHIHTFP